MTVSINGTSGLVFNDASTQNTSAFTGGFAMRNRIINGAMVIDQRNAGASVTQTTGDVFPVDRWIIGGSVTSKFTGQQNAGTVTPPAGFVNYLGITSSSAYTVGAAEVFYFRQKIEGFNVSDFGWGTANASTVTLSFWVRSSLTGTFGGSLLNSAQNRSYPFSYSIPVANTWTQISITIVGDTSGTWLTTNGVGIFVFLGLGAGATYSGTAGSWSSSTYFSATGATSVVGTNGATFYITGVQLEKGSTATSFDYRPYGTELALCQRYYCKSFNIETAPANGSTTTKIATYYGAFQGVMDRPNTTTPLSDDSGIYGAGCFSNPIKFPMQMRTNPSITQYGNSAGNWFTYEAGVGSVYYAFSGVASFVSTSQFVPNFGSIINVNVIAVTIGHWAASAEL